MSDYPEHNPDDHEDPSAAPTWLVGLVSTLLLVATMLLCAAVYYNVKRGQVEEVVIAPERAEVAVLRERQAATLEQGPAWVERDEAGQQVRALVIPIERAMVLVVQEGVD